MSALNISRHAIEQAISRHFPALNADEAWGLLRAASIAGRLVGPAPSGGDVFEAVIRLCYVRRASAKPGLSPAMVTVLPPRDVTEIDLSAALASSVNETARLREELDLQAQVLHGVRAELEDSRRKANARAAELVTAQRTAERLQGLLDGARQQAGLYTVARQQ